MSIPQFAAECGYRKSTFYAMRKNPGSTAKIQTLRRCADVMGMPLAEVLARIGYVYPDEAHSE